MFAEYLIYFLNFRLGLTLHGVGGGHGHSHSLGGGHGHSHDKKPLIENGDREAGHNYGATQDDHNHGMQRYWYFTHSQVNPVFYR